jgi:hypothetical protein
VDAERRFTDGSYRISDDKTAGTRHLKGYTGTIEGISKKSQKLNFDCRLHISDFGCRLRGCKQSVLTLSAMQDRFMLHRGWGHWIRQRARSKKLHQKARA